MLHFTMGVLAFMKYWMYLIFVCSMMVTILLFTPGLPPHGAQFTAYELSPTRKLQGPLQLNGKLNDAERLFENLIKGPESLVYAEGILYTGVHGGLVLKIIGEKLVPFVKFGKSCEGIHEEHICGRPLGLGYSKFSKMLFVADAYYGLFKVNTTSGEVLQLVHPDTLIEGQKPQLFNSLVAASDGSIYWTDSDSNFDLKNLIFSALADGSGRLIKFDPTTGTNTVLINGIHFANGVLLADDESFILVAETMKFRVLRYFLDGTRKGESDILIDGLPGMPDNLKQDENGNIYISLVSVRDEELTPNIVKNMGQYPLLRKLVARLLAVIQSTLDYLNSNWPQLLLKKLIHSIGHCETYITLISPVKRVTIIKLNINGDVLDSYHSTDGRISGISEIEFVDGYAYLASPFNNYLARVNLNKTIN